MKYRIITNGADHKIQHKIWFFWETVSHYAGGGDGGGGGPIFCPNHYATEKEAEKDARTIYGTSARRVRKWRVI